MAYRTTIYRTAHFNAAHRLHVEAWSDEKNQAVFGLCNNPSFHGHNYELHVGITGDIDEETGFVMDTKELKKLIEEEVMQKYDHRNLNKDTVEFQQLNPTVENIARVIWENLRRRIPTDLNLGIKLYETPRNYVEFNG